jgi:hypothetical protein
MPSLQYGRPNQEHFKIMVLFGTPKSTTIIHLPSFFLPSPSLPPSFLPHGTRVWTQGLHLELSPMLARQVLYLLSHTHMPFCFSFFFFGDMISRVRVFTCVSLELQSFYLCLRVTGIIDMYHHAWLFFKETWCCYIAQADLKPLSSSNSPASASQDAVTRDTCHQAQHTSIILSQSQF